MISYSLPEVDYLAGSQAAVIARQNRAYLKELLRSGDLSHTDCLQQAWSDSTCVAASLRTTEFIRTLPAVGKVKCRKIMNDLEIADSRRLGGLGYLQRKRLLQFVSDWFNNLSKQRYRHGRYTLKNKLLVGELDHETCLNRAWSNSDDVAATLSVFDFIKTFPNIRKNDIEKILVKLNVSASHELGDLDKSQQEYLLQFVSDWFDVIAGQQQVLKDVR